MFRSLFMVVAMAASVQALAHDYHAGALHIEHPWARATPAAASVGAVYFTVTNASNAPDYLISAQTPAAENVEFHETRVEDRVAKMRAGKEVEIPATGKTTLAPGGSHLMLVGLKQPLREGERIPLVLTFRNAGAVTVAIAVESSTAQPEEHKHP